MIYKNYYNSSSRFDMNAKNQIESQKNAISTTFELAFKKRVEEQHRIMLPN